MRVDICLGKSIIETHRLLACKQRMQMSIVTDGWMDGMSESKKFTSVTVFILAHKETNLLQQTVREVLMHVEADDLEKIIIVLKSDDCPAYYEANKDIDIFKSQKVETYIQKSPTLELCIAELPPLVESSHFVIMTADMEMYPKSVADMVATAKCNPDKIICATKWLKDSVVEGYGFFHRLGSRALNLFISILFNKNIKDPVTFFQIYPTDIYKKMNFEYSRKTVFEYTVRPLKAGVGYIEIPTVYKKRTEGYSNFNLAVLINGALRYMTTAVRVRFKKMS